MFCISKLKNLIILGLFIVSCSLQAGYSVAPWVFDFEENGEKDQMIKLIHTGDTNTPVPVEISILKRTVDIDGKLEHNSVEHDEDFIVYPSQVIIYPGEAQNVQIQWVGKKFPKEQTAYILYVKQVSIPMATPEAAKSRAVGAVVVEMNYEGLITLKPEGIKADVQVVSAKMVKDENDDPKLEILFQNDGTARFKFEKLNISVQSLENGRVTSEQTYSPVLAKTAIEEKIYPGYQRRMILPWPQKLPFGPVHVDVEFIEK